MMKMKRHSLRRALSALLLLPLLFALSVLPANAADAPADGSTVTWTAAKTDWAEGAASPKFTIQGYSDLKGTCCQYNVEIASSHTGTAVIRKGNRDHDAAKFIYWFGVKKGHDAGLGTADFSARVLEFGIWVQMGQISESSSWYQTDVGREYARWVAEDPDWNSRAVPANFEFYYCEAGNSQNFFLWRMGPETGKLKIKKTSAYPTITG